MLETSFRKLKKLAYARLATLSPNLTYHSIEHTRDVLKHCIRIAALEGVAGEDLVLLKTAAIYHDTGFLFAYGGHEDKSCDIFLEDIAGIAIKKTDIKTILALIGATKVPQKPKTLLQKIICDADLDYLGRKDYPSIAERLKSEFLQFSLIKNEQEWRMLQREFLKKHNYHTSSSKELREPIKQINLARLH